MWCTRVSEVGFKPVSPICWLSSPSGCVAMARRQRWVCWRLFKMHGRWGVSPVVQSQDTCLEPNICQNGVCVWYCIVFVRWLISRHSWHIPSEAFLRLFRVPKINGCHLVATFGTNLPRNIDIFFKCGSRFTIAQGDLVPTIPCWIGPLKTSGRDSGDPGDPGPRKGDTERSWNIHSHPCFFQEKHMSEKVEMWNTEVFLVSGRSRFTKCVSPCFWAKTGRSNKARVWKIYHGGSTNGCNGGAMGWVNQWETWRKCGFHLLKNKNHECYQEINQPRKNGASLHVVSHHFPACHHGGGPDHVQALALWYCEWLDTYYDRALTQLVIRCRPRRFCMGSLWRLHGDLMFFDLRVI